MGLGLEQEAVGLFLFAQGQRGDEADAWR